MREQNDSALPKSRLSYDFLITESLKLLVWLRSLLASHSRNFSWNSSWRRESRKVHCTIVVVVALEKWDLNSSQRVSREYFVGNIIKMTPLTWKKESSREGSFNPSRTESVCEFFGFALQIVIVVVFFLGEKLLSAAKAAATAAAQKSQFQQMQHKFFFVCSVLFFLTLRVRSARAEMLAGVVFKGEFIVCLGAMQYLSVASFLSYVQIFFFRVQWSGCDNEIMVGWLKMRNKSEENYLRDFKIAYACKFMMEHCSYDTFFSALLRSAAVFTMMKKWIAKVVRMKMRRWMSAWLGIWARCILAEATWKYVMTRSYEDTELEKRYKVKFDQSRSRDKSSTNSPEAL